MVKPAKPQHIKNEKNQQKARALLSQMTLEEKIGQLQQAPYFSTVVTGHKVDHSGTIEAIKAGRVGSVLSVYDEDDLKMLQKTAVEDSRLGIPLMFMFDVIHGYKTAFPINLALSNSWDPSLIERVSEAVAFEASHAGLHVTFSPMVDLVRDPRWGRVMESNGEDPYLSSELTKAYVRGYQQGDLSKPHAMAACLKHFAGYGFVEAGREYNHVELTERTLRNMVFPPFQAGIEEDVSMVMTSFNTIHDRPATANRWLLTDVLRDEMQFKGVVISDYTSSDEILEHRVAKDLKDVAYQCFDAGLDHDMVGKSYQKHLAELVEEGRVSEHDVDERVLRILDLKFQLGLFEDPYRNFYDNSHQYQLTDRVKALALEAVEKTTVLLKNEGVLPLKKNQKVGLVGPFIDNQDVIGEWAALCQKEDVITLLEAFKEAQHPYERIQESALQTIAFDDTVETVIVALGEAGNEAGEGHSKAHLRLSKTQETLLKQVKATGKNVVLIIFAGRPLILTELEPFADAILYAYQPGTMAGVGVYNLLSGRLSPSAKLTLSFPYHEGQIPVYYNHPSTGRPFDQKRPDYRYNTRYIDIPNEPLYPFGYGLSYGEFEYQNLTLDRHHLMTQETLTVSVDVTNVSNTPAVETIQLYIEAQTFSVSRPISELKRFEKRHFDAGETHTITFTLTIDDFKSYNIDMVKTAESHRYHVKVGPNSATLIHASLDVHSTKK